MDVLSQPSYLYSLVFAFCPYFLPAAKPAGLWVLGIVVVVVVLVLVVVVVVLLDIFEI